MTKMIKFPHAKLGVAFILAGIIILNFTQLNIPFWNWLLLIIIMLPLGMLMSDKTKTKPKDKHKEKILKKREYEYKSRATHYLFILIFVILVMLPNILLHIFDLSGPLISFVSFTLALVLLAWAFIENLDVLNKYFPTQIVRSKTIDTTNYLFKIEMKLVSGETIFANEGIYQTLTSKFYNFYPWDNFDYYVKDSMAKDSILIYKKKGKYINTSNRWGQRNNEYLVIPIEDKHKEELVKILDKYLKCIDKL